MRRSKNIIKFGVILLVILSITLIAIYWINRDPNRELKRQVITMQERPITLEFNKAKTFFAGRDTAYIDAPVNKLIIFVDSLSCSSCMISKLGQYLEVNDTLSSKNSQMLVILHPPKKYQEEVISKLRRERFPFWCIVDLESEFIRKNTAIPENPLLHTFTLNRDDNVILVGDPTKNEKIWDLFHRVLE